MIVKKAVRDFIILFYDRGMKLFVKDIGISGWDIEHAHPKHQLSGLRKLRELKAEFNVDRPDLPAYIIEKNKYFVSYYFYKWLESHYKD